MSVVFDRAATFYDQTRGIPLDAETWLAQTLREHTEIRAGSRVLEIGVGTGRIALPLVRANQYRYTGVDLSRDMMAVLRSKAADLPIALATADITRLPFADATFDAVVAVHIFHLVSDAPAAMDEARRVLRPNGVLLHGYNERDPASAVARLREAMTESVQANRFRAAAGLIEKDHLRAALLEQRFGAPRTIATPHWQTETTAQQVIDKFGARIWSCTWPLSDEQIATAVEHGTAWALHEFGRLDAPLVDEERFMWEVYTRQ